MHSLSRRLQLEGKDSEELSPARIADALGQVVIPHQVGHSQVFMIDHVVGLHQLGGLLVMEVAALPCNVLLGFGQQGYRFASAAAALFAPCYPSLAAAQIRFGLTIVTRGADRLPVGQGGKRLQPQIDRRLLPSGWEGINRYLRTRDRHIPYPPLWRS